MIPRTKILTFSEVKELCIKMRNGDIEARNKIIESNLRLVGSIANNLKGLGIEIDDLIAIGYIGLIKAVDTFDFEKGIKFSTYGGACIRNEMLMSLRKEVKHHNVISLNAPIIKKTDNHDEVSMEGVLGENIEMLSKEYAGRIRNELINKVLDKLTLTEKKILQLRFGLKGSKPLTQKEVGNQMNVSRSCISRKEKKILRKIRAMPISEQLREFVE